ncbi:hypothetical protein DYB32_003043 [Aphanomyces invadans]|uniref:HSF-type DNA-binding domain-containing protein n=1 Tax=Aphanomyces invadans TaxID=157072 RepID=A0A418B1M0_9STRA|nr:hypothetical protein DYB32_003043 [Aphanomyces invadans]
MQRSDRKELVAMDLPAPKEDAAAAAAAGLIEKEDKDAVLPAFLSKTYEIFSTPSFASICGWNATGDTIIIHDPDVFVKQVLPRFFKHRNLPSFVRQLNMYGFHKSVLDSNKREFRHKMFLRDKPEMLRLIKRKVNTTPASSMVPSAAAMEMKRDELSHEILNEMRSLKVKNDLMEKRLRDVEIDNAIVRSDNLKLWKQLESAKEKQLVMQEKMKKILWVLFQIYRGKHAQVPTLSTDKSGATILTEELVAGTSRLGSNEFRDALRFLAMDDPPLLQAADGSLPTTSTDKLQLPKGALKKRKFVEVPTMSALPAPGTPVNHLQHNSFAAPASSANAVSNMQDHFFEILETSPPRMQQLQKTIKPKKAKTNMIADNASTGNGALSIFSPLGTFTSSSSSTVSIPHPIVAAAASPPPPLSLEKSHSFDGTQDNSIMHTDLMDDDLLLHDDSLNFGEVESEVCMHGFETTWADSDVVKNVMRKLEDFETSLLNEYDVTCLDSLLKQINTQPPGHQPTSATTPATQPSTTTTTLM